MIITLEPDAPAIVEEAVVRLAERYPGVSARRYEFRGASTTVVEIHLLGPTRCLPTDAFEALAGVRKVVRVSVKYRLIGRPHPSVETPGFEYNGVQFDDRRVHLFAGLCAVDTRDHVELMLVQRFRRDNRGLHRHREFHWRAQQWCARHVAG